MRRHIVAASLCAGWLGVVPARADTLLHVTDTETVSLPPDELAASLRAEASNGSAAEAQQRVNAAMADALKQAHQVPGITISTGSYTMWHVGPTQQDHTERWQAGQSLELTGRDGVVLLKLVGELQQKGLAVGQLAWRLSEQSQRKAHDEATHKALEALTGKVEDAAKVLHLRFDSFKQVRLGASPPPMPRFAGAAMALAAPGAAPPSAESNDVPVSATVEADAVLLPN